MLGSGIRAAAGARRVSLVLFACVALVGCSIAFERNSVSRRFGTVFNCDNPKVTSTGGGYRAEGCGVVAHFVCFDTDSDSDEHREDTPGGALVRSLLDESMDPDTCILEHSERRRAPAVAPAELPNVARAQEDDGSVTVRTRALFRGGHLVALGRPEKVPDHALLFVKSIRVLDQAPCTAGLFVDGVSIPLEQLQRHNDHEARLLIRTEALRDADQAVRVAGNVCGTEFEIDDNGRAALGLFEARFREERSRLDHATSGGDEAGAQAVGPGVTR